MGRKKGRLSRGQPLGARSASGRKRDRTPASILPSPGVVRRRELYRLPANDVGEADNDRTARRGKQETDTCDALGRAYTAGLLGSGGKAQQMLLAGRKIAAQYWRVYGFPTPDSLARFQPQQSCTPMDPAKERIREDALNDALALVRARGRTIARAFEMLVIDINPDQGPLWLDQIVWAHRHGKRATEGDYGWLAAAIEGLEAVA